MRRLLELVGITPDKAKIEIRKTVKFTNGDGEIIEINKPISAIKIRKID
jgi:hypothetical protein